MFALSTIPAEAQGIMEAAGMSPSFRIRRFCGAAGSTAASTADPYYPGFGPWYPYPYAYPPGVYPNDPAVSVRLQVTPREASVFVDGYAAGSWTTTTASFSG